MTKETLKTVRGSRPKRAPLGSRSRLNVSNRDPALEYRFVNDRDGRVEMFQQNGWNVELAANHIVGDARVDGSRPAGSAARYPVGLGDYSVLMSIPKDWYDEDQREKQARVDASEQTIKQDALSGHSGKFEVSRGS